MRHVHHVSRRSLSLCLWFPVTRYARRIARRASSSTCRAPAGNAAAAAVAGLATPHGRDTPDEPRQREYRVCVVSGSVPREERVPREIRRYHPPSQADSGQPTAGTTTRLGAKKGRKRGKIGASHVRAARRSSSGSGHGSSVREKSRVSRGIRARRRILSWAISQGKRSPRRASGGGWVRGSVRQALWITGRVDTLSPAGGQERLSSLWRRSTYETRFREVRRYGSRGDASPLE